jgi:hypothetical protein
MYRTPAEVFVLAMNRATGALELIEKTPVPGTDKLSPASLPMAADPTRVSRPRQFCTSLFGPCNVRFNSAPGAE